MDLNKIKVIIGGVEYPRTTNSNAFFRDLEYSVGFGSVGSGNVSIYSTSKQTNITVGEIVCITYDRTPFYSGYITGITDTNNWCYYSTNNEKIIINISFKEASGMLAYESVDPTVIEGYNGVTPIEMAEKILGRFKGDLPTSTDVYIAYSITEDSVLNQLNKLSKQTGWRYRVKPTSTTEFVIDFGPSFYQDAKVGTFKINLSARNNSETDSTFTGYGQVTAVSSTTYGDSYACTIPLLGEHHPDYTMDYTKMVKASWDGECVSWQYNSSNADKYIDPATGATKTFPGEDAYHTVSGVLNCDMNPTDPQIIDDMQLIYYIGGSYTAANIKDLVRDNKFTSKQVVDRSKEVPGYFSFSFEATSDIKSAMEKETGSGDCLIMEVKSNIYCLSDCGGMPTTGSGYIGAEPISYEVLDASSGIIRLTISRYTYFHKKGILFIYVNTPQPNSPKELYPDTTYYAVLQSDLGYSLTEYMASMLAIYGSNFDAQGSCMVPLSMFKRDDNGLLWVGDRIGIYNSKEKKTTDYELLSYSVSIQSMTVTMRYGTYIVGLPDIINGIKSNMTTSIRQ